MVLLRAATVGPRGAVPVRPLRLMASPFQPEGVAMQGIQPWANKHPENLSDAQLTTVGHLIEAAAANKGTLGTVINPKTGRPMPAIAGEVAKYFKSRGWTVSPEEKRERRTARREERLEESRARMPQYATFKEKLSGIDAASAGKLIGV